MKDPAVLFYTADFITGTYFSFKKNYYLCGAKFKHIHEQES